MSLAVGVGNLALSAAVLSEVRKLTGLVERLVGWTEQADVKLDRLAQAVARVETKVEENNLRHALEHTSRRAASDDGLDLVQLARARGEIMKFAEAAGGFQVGGNAGLRLSADVHDTLEHVWLVARSVRRIILAAPQPAVRRRSGVDVRKSRRPRLPAGRLARVGTFSLGIPRPLW